MHLSSIAGLLGLGKNLSKFRLTKTFLLVSIKSNFYYPTSMADPGCDINDGGGRHGTKCVRDAAPEPYEAEIATKERESNPPEEEPDTRPDP